MGDKMTVQEAAKYLGIPIGTLRGLIWKKEGPRHYKFLKRLYFDKKDLDAFLRSRIEIRAS